MRATPQILAAIVGVPVTYNMVSVIEGLKAFPSGIDTGLRFAHYVAQLAHETGRFRYDEEVWGPTPAQSRYDTRTDLGNTSARDGDGFKYRGRGPIQITGKYNYADFAAWCRKHIAKNAPDFVETPDLVNTDPWEGLVPIWYWETRGLNKLVDRNMGDLRGLTKRINGGYNGLRDRAHLFTRAALVVLGYHPSDVRLYQQEKSLKVDGIAGPRTRDTLAKDLKGVRVTYKDKPVAGAFSRLFDAILRLIKAWSQN